MNSIVPHPVSGDDVQLRSLMVGEVLTALSNRMAGLSRFRPEDKVLFITFSVANSRTTQFAESAREGCGNAENNLLTAILPGAVNVGATRLRGEVEHILRVGVGHVTSV
ncbi:hypothetical protein [Williamsia sp. 1138]|uniref:hypothetical protein n=1 Tax=Williamsia sp. 1138 TaxID=1903117 RepID=UPI00143CE89C|nr:hypothetical protein [Williamsia sp. 1138]